MIPLAEKMSANPKQEEEFNIYAYIKQLITDDVSGVCGWLMKWSL